MCVPLSLDRVSRAVEGTEFMPFRSGNGDVPQAKQHSVGSAAQDHVKVVQHIASQHAEVRRTWVCERCEFATYGRHTAVVSRQFDRAVDKSKRDCATYSMELHIAGRRLERQAELLEQACAEDRAVCAGINQELLRDF
jgi:hypothetical protein